METVGKALRNWKIHALALALSVVAELIGGKTFDVGPAKLVLVPMFYSFILGAVIILRALLSLLIHFELKSSQTRTEEKP